MHALEIVESYIYNTFYADLGYLIRIGPINVLDLHKYYTFHYFMKGLSLKSRPRMFHTPDKL